MKIAIFTDTFYPMVNGIVTAILNTAKPLADQGHKIFIVTPKIGKEEDFSYPNIVVKRVPSLPAGFYEDFRWPNVFNFSAYRLLKKEGIDLVHFMTPFMASYMGIKIARSLDVPVIGTFHTFISDPTYYEHMFSKGWKPNEKTVWKYTNFYYNAADLVTAPSPSTLKAMMENGCDTPGMVISNGIDPELFDNDNWRGFKEKYNLGDKVILYFGRIAQEKNLTTLVEGFRKAWKEDNELQLLLIGDGPQRKEIEKTISKQEHKESVIFTGTIPHEELVQSGVFKAVKLFVSASRTENQPMTILEAQANGLVCVGADARGIPDLVKDGENGLLFNPTDSDALAQAILDLTSREDSQTKHAQFQKATEEMIQEHLLPNVVQKWSEVYPQVIEDYQAGKYPQKDYLHLKTIIGITRDFKFEFGQRK